MRPAVEKTLVLAPAQPQTIAPARHASTIRVRDGKSGVWELSGVEGESGPSYALRVASGRDTRARAYRLAHEIYKQKGYVDRPSGLCVAPYDSRPETITLIVESSEGRDVATVSLLCDSDAGLPCDETYGPEVELLRKRRRRLVEVTRLAMAENVPQARMVLLQLFSFVYLVTRWVHRGTDMIIEVNPRHVNYYRRALLFEPEGPERPCARVAGAPAILLRAPISRIDEAVRSGECQPRGHHASPYCFYEREEFAQAADYVRTSFKPMSDDDIVHFEALR
jgi:hypothetical protein